MKRRGWLLVISFWLVVQSAALAQGLTGMTIVIDPGHGGNNPANDRRLEPDPGNVFWESESNFQKALWLKSLLEARGAIVLLTRNTNYYPTDEDPSLSARVEFANANNVDWFHSIHSNAGGANYTLMLVREQIVPGGSAIYGPGTGQPEWPQAWAMSLIMSPTIRTYMRTTDSRVRRDWDFYGGSNGGYTLGVLRGLIMPGELSEGSFHDFAPETRRLMNNDYRKMEAYALLQSFQQYFAAPMDQVGIVAGNLTDYETSKPINNAIVRLLTDGRVYTGDAYNNGFYMFDSVSPGTHWIRFETAGYTRDSVQVSVAPASVTFLDRNFYGMTAATVTFSSPRQGDSAFAVNASLGIVFSRPMDTTATRLAFSLTPAVAGAFMWTNANKTLIFRPTVPLPYGSVFVMRVETTAVTPTGVPLDAKGLGIANAHIAEFRTAPAPTGVELSEPQVPTSTVLLHNFPNPFNPTTTLTVELPRRTIGSLIVVDALGREVARLFDGELEAGVQTFTFDASGLTSGVYLCILQTSEARSSVKLMLLK